MKLNVCKKLCNECPFSKNSLNGWLGGATVQETLDAMQNEMLFSCHKTRGEDIHQNLSDIVHGKQPICRGFILSAKKSCKMFGQTPINGQALLKLQNEIELTDEDRENILTRWEFKEHHSI